MQILPLTGLHDRQGFDCGRAELNGWLQRMARQHQDRGLSKTFVAVLEEAPTAICGYYALTVTEVDTDQLPTALRRRLPRVIPGVRLARLAVAKERQGLRLGELLLVDAMERVRLISRHAGVVGLFVDAIDARAAGFYARYGFQAFADAPLKLFFPVTT